MVKKSFIQGAAVLAVAGLFVKFLGAAFRIPLANLIGDVGMANYTPAYYVYNLFLILATAGIPVAISKMVAERVTVGDFREAERVFTLSRYLMIGIGVFSFVVVFFGAPIFAALFKLPGSALAMRTIAPALVIVPLMASYRGYFQGMQNMKPTAISQVMEQVFRVAIGLSLAYAMFQGTVGNILGSNFSPQEKGAAGASFGATAGAVGGLLVMLVIYAVGKKTFKRRIARERKKPRQNGGAILKNIAMIAIPITIGAAIMPIVNLIDAAIVMERLQSAGWSEGAAQALYGQLTGFVAPIINFPQVLTQAVAMSLVPLVAAAYKQKDMVYLQENVSFGLRTAILLGMPCAFGLAVLAQPILLLLYASQKVSAMSAASCLLVMAVGVIFLSTVQTLTGVLQGIGKQLIPVRNLVIGIGVKIVVTWILTGIHDVNVKGAAAGTVAAYLIAALLNLLAVKKYTGTRFDIKITILKPLIASVVMAACAWGAYKVFFGLLQSNGVATLLAIVFAAIVYVVMIFITKSITREELSRMPKGGKLVRILDRIRK
ncbi:MAG: polysaccharide biosynthesis protein [Anaerovoracaceae bacterium]